MESNLESDLVAQVHALLFSEGGSVAVRKLARVLGVDEAQVKSALTQLTERLRGTGITVIQTDTEASLVATSETAPIIQKALEREFTADIGDAGLEVLAVVLYRGPSSRAQIDYIRGVNTSSTIRTLLSRGLLERTGNPEDGREYLYRPTVDLLAHLGIRGVSELPEFDRVISELKEFEANLPGLTAHNTSEENSTT